jgi:hypothetical protein
MPVAYKWRPIADLGENPKSLTDGELESLKRVWANQKDEMVQLGTLDEFEKRLRREWAIETGIIEGVYTLTRGVTRTLIAKGIEAALIPHNATNRDPVLVARIIQDHYDVLETLFDFVGGQRQLSTRLCEGAARGTSAEHRDLYRRRSIRPSVREAARKGLLQKRSQQPNTTGWACA